MKLEELNDWRNKREKLYLKELKGWRTNARFLWVYEATTASYVVRGFMKKRKLQMSWVCRKLKLEEEDEGLISWVYEEILWVWRKLKLEEEEEEDETIFVRGFMNWVHSRFMKWNVKTRVFRKVFYAAGFAEPQYILCYLLKALLNRNI